ncbi:hypothetical protein Q3G72_013839 [Acer saccharum]|nr:hypothetical protein Q3G72_013839 [Acer saccharum]
MGPEAAGRLDEMTRRLGLTTLGTENERVMAAIGSAMDDGCWSMCDFMEMKVTMAAGGGVGVVGGLTSIDSMVVEILDNGDPGMELAFWFLLLLIVISSASSLTCMGSTEVAPSFDSSKSIGLAGLSMVI